MLYMCFMARLFQCRINHMAEAAYATGPALLGAPRLLSSISPRIFCSLFQRGPQTVCQCGAPKSPSPPENARPQIKFKKRGTRKRGPKRFFCSLFQCFSGGPKGPKVPKNVRPQNLKIEAPKFKTRGPKRFVLFPVSARDPNNAAQREIQTRPPKRSPKIKNARLQKQGRKKFFCSFFGQGAPKSEAKKIIGVRKFQNSQFFFFKVTSHENVRFSLLNMAQRILGVTLPNF